MPSIGTNQAIGNAQSVVDSFASDVFNLTAMKKYLSPVTFKLLEETMQNAAPLNPSIADEVANGMKTWAMEKGATHFTHWFQPLTGSTAEKHDSFVTPDFKGGVMSQFSGKELTQGEPDASSFPSGGLRATFEARGYTAWDPTSPAFVINAGTQRAVLCIPCIFCGYRGEALDEKTPLLRSQAALVKQVTRVADLFEIAGERRPYATLGPEQEYFLIDAEYYQRRPDIVMCGRSLFGNRPARHQQMDDHYFGRIKPRILAFMAETDRRLWRLGIPAKTRHNEVSPAQFELAPVFEEQTVAVDHNMVTMHVLQDTAAEFGFTCLLHEKPFAGVNGSGKHNNWSIVGRDGKNWFAPGQSPHEDAKFMFMLIAVVKAIDTHAGLIRASVATAGNEHRLGANEAPPAIISVYLGEQLEDIVTQMQTGGSIKCRAGGGLIEVGVDCLPKIPQDVSDRNRTSPFAFTGNKFEFRAVGSSQSCAGANTILNLAMANALDEMCAAMEAGLAENTPHKDASGHSREFHEVLHQVLAKEIRMHKKVIFGGDGYGEEWREEAQRRGLPNVPSTREALDALVRPEALSLFSRYGVLNEKEAVSRYEVYRHAWMQTVAMEGECMLDLARTFVMPATLKYEASLAASAAAAKAMGHDSTVRNKAFGVCADLVDRLYAASELMDGHLHNNNPDGILEAMKIMRIIVDKIEALSPDADWPFPCYGEMLFMGQ